MVSRKMLADVDRRLKEWRAFRKHPGKKAAFGGVGVILVADFGQLPPTQAEHLSLPLSLPSSVSPCLPQAFPKLPKASLKLSKVFPRPPKAFPKEAQGSK